MTTTPTHLWKFRKLLQPSFMGSLISIATALAIVGTTMYTIVSRTDVFNYYFPDLAGKDIAFYDNYQRVSDAINSNDLVGNGVIFIIWAIIGLALYYIIIGIIVATTDARQFLDHLSYVHTNKVIEWHDALIGLLLRVIAMISLIGFIDLFMTHFLPYCLSLVKNALVETGYVSILDTLQAVVIIALSIHIVVILVRLFLLRVRIFFGKYDFNY